MGRDLSRRTVGARHDQLTNAALATWFGALRNRRVCHQRGTLVDGERTTRNTARRKLGRCDAPSLHITFLEAVGRRLRHNYGWIFFIQVTSYIGKLLIHPTPIGSVDEFFARATIGPVPGQLVLLAGLLS